MTKTENKSPYGQIGDLCYYKEGAIRCIVEIKQERIEDNMRYMTVEVKASITRGGIPTTPIGTILKPSCLIGYEDYPFAFLMQRVKASTSEDAVAQVDKHGMFQWVYS